MVLNQRQGETDMRCGYDHIDPVVALVQTADETRLFAQEMQETLDIPAVHEALERGFTSSADVERTRSAWIAWGEHPDAFIAVTWCEASGWAD